MIGLNRFQKIKSIEHLLISFFAAMFSYFMLNFLNLNLLTQLMFTWIVFCLVQAGISWYIFTHTSAEQVRMQANLDDETRAGIFLLVVLSTFAGLLAVFLILVKNNEDPKWLQTTLGISGMFLSWFLVHTIFAVRYAHLYYDEVRDGIKVNTGGLDFPGDEAPDFIDFAYYSLVIGMTFQVSDVNITSKQMRRLTLAHSVIAFVFNSCIVALTINAIAGLAN